MEQASATARLAMKHEAKPYHNGNFTSWSERQSPSHPNRFDDAVRIWVNDVDLSPDEDWLD